MLVHVNGKPQEVSDGLSVAELVEQLGLEGRPVAVEQNQTIVPGSRHQETRVLEGDRFEIVTLVGGG